VVLDYPFSVLKWGGGFFIALAVICLPGVLLQLGASGQGPAKPGQEWVAPVLLSGLCVVGLGLFWLAARLRERYELDPTGFRWRKGGRLRVHLPLDEIQHLILDVHNRVLIIQGRGAPTITLNQATYPKHFEEFLQRLKELVPWETLLSDRLRQTPSGAEVVRPLALPSLPLVHERKAKLWVLLVMTVVLAGLSVLLWRIPLAEPAGGRRDDNRQMHLLARYFVPGLGLLTLGGFLFGWTQFVVEPEGIVFRFLLGSRRYRWRDLALVKLQIQYAQQQGSGKNILVIQRRRGRPIDLDMEERTVLFRDAILEAASKAGVNLGSEAGR
jgi:hypothetical protein